MFGNDKKQNSTTPTAQAQKPQKVGGTTYDLCRKVKQEDGSEKLQRIGTVFIRATGNGGVAFVTEPDGSKHELPIFARSRKTEAPKQAAAPQEAATAA